MNKIKRTCFKCQRDVMMYKQDNGPWIYEELDGSPHQHAGTNVSKDSQPNQQTFTNSRKNRDDAIERMHNENIEAINKLTAAILKLAEREKI